MLKFLYSSPPTSPVYHRHPWKDFLRWGLLMCVSLLSLVSFTNLRYVQHSVDSWQIETLPSSIAVSPVGHRQHPSRSIDSLLWQENQRNPVKRNVETSSSPENEDGLPCLIHETVFVNASSRRMSDPNQTLLLSQQPLKCGTLKRKWLHNPPLSKLARQIEQHQTNCSSPVAVHYFDNTFGMGAHFILWGQAMCNAMQVHHQTSANHNSSYRILSRSEGTWLWLDQSHCDTAPPGGGHESPLLCYFPKAEGRCDDHDSRVTSNKELSSSSSFSSVQKPSTNVSDPRNQKFHCPLVRNQQTRSLFRAAATEYLFQQVSPLVIQEAKRQLGLVFALTDGVVPDDLVTVHIRWGDKFWEMDLPPIQEYIDAIYNLTESPNVGDENIGRHNLEPNKTSKIVHVYLATEDPKAYEAFMRAKPKEWIVHADITLMEINAFRPPKGNRASWATRNTKGRAGLVALGSLLVAMEANRFVLTTKSNWSTLMNHLRTNIINPRCNNCTRMIDLRPGEYY